MDLAQRSRPLISTWRETKLSPTDGTVTGLPTELYDHPEQDPQGHALQMPALPKMNNF